MAVTVYFPPKPAVVGDLLVWEMTGETELPVGATRIPGVRPDGVWVCWRVATEPGLPWPRPTYMVCDPGEPMESGTGVPWVR